MLNLCELSRLMYYTILVKPYLSLTLARWLKCSRNVKAMAYVRSGQNKASCKHLSHDAPKL